MGSATCHLTTLSPYHSSVAVEKRLVRCYAADLHIHTALSPCAAEEMTPPAIVQAARRNGLAMIAVCDHNAAGNTAAVQVAAGDSLSVLAGMEITTAEEVHVLGLFPSAAAAQAAAGEVQRTLPTADKGYFVRFGPQLLFSSDGSVVGHERRMLALASRLSLSEAVNLIHRHDGLAVAAHVNRPSFSVLSQLGVFPTDVGFDALEVFAPPDRPPLIADFAGYGLPVISSSDSHFLADIGTTRTTLRMKAATFEELRLTFRGLNGRGVAHA